LASFLLKAPTVIECSWQSHRKGDASLAIVVHVPEGAKTGEECMKKLHLGLGMIIAGGLLTGSSCARFSRQSDDVGAGGQRGASETTQPSDQQPTSGQIRTEVYKLIDKNAATINFQTGRAEITESDRANLKSIFEATQQEQGIDRIIIAAWSDQEYPATRDATLPSAARDLAKSRSDSLESALREIGARQIESYSMAEHPGWIARTFRTDEAHIKGQGEASATEDQMIQDIGKQLRERGGPGKAVVYMVSGVAAAAH